MKRYLAMAALALAVVSFVAADHLTSPQLDSFALEQWRPAGQESPCSPSSL